MSMFPLGEWLEDNDLYFDGKISYEEMEARNERRTKAMLDRMKTEPSPISHTTTEVLPSGSTVTTYHLTDEGREGLTCDAEAFRRACGISDETGERNVYGPLIRRETLSVILWLAGFLVGTAIFATAVFQNDSLRLILCGVAFVIAQGIAIPRMLMSLDELLELRQLRDRRKDRSK